MKRLKNKALWVAIFAFIPMLVAALTDYNIFVTLPHNYGELVAALLGILIIAGILNNPDKGEWYKDE